MHRESVTHTSTYHADIRGIFGRWPISVNFMLRSVHAGVRQGFNYIDNCIHAARAD